MKLEMTLIVCNRCDLRMRHQGWRTCKTEGDSRNNLGAVIQMKDEHAVKATLFFLVVYNSGCARTGFYGFAT